MSDTLFPKLKALEKATRDALEERAQALQERLQEQTARNAELLGKRLVRQARAGKSELIFKGGLPKELVDDLKDAGYRVAVLVSYGGGYETRIAWCDGEL